MHCSFHRSDEVCIITYFQDILTPMKLAALGRQSALDQALAHQQRPTAGLADGDHHADGPRCHQLHQGGMSDGVHGEIPAQGMVRRRMRDHALQNKLSCRRAGTKKSPRNWGLLLMLLRLFLGRIAWALVSDTRCDRDFCTASRSSLPWLARSGLGPICHPY